MKKLLLLILLITFSAAQAQEPDADRILESGIQALENENYELAREEFDKAIRLDPGLMDAYLYRAAAYEQLELADQALLDYIVYLNAFPERVEVLLSASVLNYRLEHYEDARKGFRQLLELPAGTTSMVYYRQPVHGEGITGMFTAQTKDRSFLYNYLGLCEEGLGNLNQALSLLDTAISIQPANADYYVNRGNIYRKSGQYEEAESDFSKALELTPENALARYNLANLIEESGDLQSAVRFYSESIRDNASSPLAYRQRGFRYLQQGEIDKALADFNQAITLDPNNAETLVNRGIVLNTKGKYEEALGDFARAIDLKPDLEKAYYNRGNSLYYLKEYENALNDYNVALIYDPEYGQAVYMRALTLYYLENFQQACKDIKLAESLGIPQARQAKGRICREVGSQ